MLKDIPKEIKRFFKWEIDSVVCIYEKKDKLNVAIASMNEDGCPVLEYTDTIQSIDRDLMLARTLSYVKEVSATVVCLDNHGSETMLVRQQIEELEGLSDKEIKSAMYWELTEAMADNNLIMDCLKQDGMIWSGAIAKEKLENILDEYILEYPNVVGILADDALMECFWYEEGGMGQYFSLSDSNVCYQDQGIAMAVYGAIAFLKKKAICFHLERKFYGNWRWLRLAGAVVAVDVVLAGFIGGWLLSLEIENQNKEQMISQQLALFQDLQSEKGEIETIQKDTQQRKRILVKLSEESAADYGMLVNIGISCTPGTAVKALNWSRNGNLRIDGETDSYKNLEVYMEKLNKCCSTDSEKLRLQQTRKLDSGKIAFSCSREENNK